MNDFLNKPLTIGQHVVWKSDNVLKKGIVQKFAKEKLWISTPHPYTKGKTILVSVFPSNLVGVS